MMDTQNGNTCPFVVAQTKKFLDHCFYVVAQTQWQFETSHGISGDGLNY